MNNHAGRPLANLNDTLACNSPGHFDASIYRQITGLLSPDRLKVHLQDLVIELGKLSILEASEGLKDAAHKMVSKAGTFGFTELSDLCRELETALADSRPASGLMADIRLAAARALLTIRKLESRA